MSHTLEPWEISKQNGCLDDEGLVGIVGPLRENSHGKEYRLYVAQYVKPEDAKLIVAAPRLLKTLKAIVGNGLLKSYPAVELSAQELLAEVEAE